MFIVPGVQHISVSDLHDPQRYGDKLANQLELLADADIPEADRTEIHAYIRHLDATDAVNTGTMVAKLNRLRLSSERAHMPLTEMNQSDVETFLFDLKRERDLSEGTLRNYRKALRTFYQYRDADWADNITIGASPDRTVDPADLLSMDEINTLLETAQNPRDTALIALLADSGLRIGAVASLRLKDVDLSGTAATVSINEAANVKGASGTTPLTWSEGYIANWLSAHPRPDTQSAPLFHVRAGWYDPDDGDGSLDYQYLARRIRTIADEADIDRERVNTHNFRKSAISRWIREGMSDQEIKHRAHWDVDTDQFGVYSGVRDEELNEQILAHYGLDEGTDAHRPDLDRCPRCGTTLAGGETFCPGCAAPLTDAAAAETDATRDEIFEAAATTDASSVELLTALRERFDDDPAFRAALLGEDHD